MTLTDKQKQVEEVVEKSTMKMMAYWIGSVDEDKREALYSDLEVITRQILKLVVIPDKDQSLPEIPEFPIYSAKPYTDAEKQAFRTGALTYRNKIKEANFRRIIEVSDDR